MSTGDVRGFDALYDPGNVPILAYEKERARFYYNGLGARWGNRPVLGYTITIQLIELRPAGTTVTARLYEQIRMTWIPPRMAALAFPWTAGAAPSLALSPGQAACSQPNFPVAIHGAGFTPGQALELYDYDAGTPSRPGIGMRAGTTTVGPDGAFDVVIELTNCGPGTPAGAQFTLAAFGQGGTGGGLPTALATVVFTVQALPGLPNTGGGGAHATGWTWSIGLSALVLGMLGKAALWQRARTRRNSGRGMLTPA